MNNPNRAATAPSTLFWAKTDRRQPVDPSRSHPLICHSIDVGMMALALMQESVPPAARHMVAAQLGVTTDEACSLLAYWAALHDLGKATPAFQSRWPPGLARLQAAGFDFDLPALHGRTLFHATLTTSVLKQMAAVPRDAPHTAGHILAMSEGATRIVARALGGHHGLWPTSTAIDALTSDQSALGQTPPWLAARAELVRNLRSLFNPPYVHALGHNREAQAFLVMFLSGLTTVADWLGSMEQHFTFHQGPLNLPTYARKAMQTAHHVIAAEGWTAWEPATGPTDFTTLFSFAPNSLQQRVIQLAEGFTSPTLLIVETPTGSGKTEAAFMAMDALARLQGQRGFYIAMPTTATSNQMHTRANAYLERRYTGRQHPARLLHAQAQWIGPESDRRLNADDGLLPEEKSSDARALSDRSWFLPAKRGLLEPLAVGTVDQALLSVLQAKHFFVRLWGLAHKTVIFDEVHAYDTYMSTLFERLLAWLHILGTSVILLSATLPAATRRKLIAAYAGAVDTQLDLPAFSYPGISIAHAGATKFEPISWADQRTLRLGLISPEPAALCDLLAQRLVGGGCAAVICNTVGRAQEVYRTLKASGRFAHEELVLFHARFPLGWRNEIERAVLHQFGKPATPEVGKHVEDQHTAPEQESGGPPFNTIRPRTVLIATQVVEQSLDLDFDLLISDLAPIDLLIQRAGRLHRHRARARPAALCEPWLYVAVELDTSGEPLQQSDKFYHWMIMLATWYTLRRSGIEEAGGGLWHLPDDTVTLIESVYDGQPADHFNPAEIGRLNAASAHFNNEQRQAVAEAKKRLVKHPQKEDVMQLSGIERSAEDATVHKDLQALTRLGDPNVQLVCLHQTARGLATRPDETGALVDLSAIPAPELTRSLVLASVAVSSRDVFTYFFSIKPPTGWANHSLLQHYRAVVFNQDGDADIPAAPFTLHLDREFGLQIRRGGNS